MSQLPDESPELIDAHSEDIGGLADEAPGIVSLHRTIAESRATEVPTTVSRRPVTTWTGPLISETRPLLDDRLAGRCCFDRLGETALILSGTWVVVVTGTMIISPARAGEVRRSDTTE